MPRPRIIHRSAGAVDLRQVQSPLQPAITAPSAVAPTAATPDPPRLTAVEGGSAMHRVQMENVHPLRLRLLLEIDRTGSISAAAERCAIGQPSASMHVRTLENAIGQRLVIRNGRGSRLTAAGKIVASHAAQMLTTLDRMRWSLDALNAPSGGEVTLAANDTASLVLVPPVLRDFSERYPGVSVKVRTLPSEMVVRELARGAADIGIAGEVACTEPIVREQILIDELVGIAPVGLLSSNGGSVGRAEFARHTLLIGPEGSSTRMVTERHLAHAEYRPARIWAFDSCEAIKRAVADGLGFSFMSRLLVEDEIARGHLARFRISGIGRMLRSIHAMRPSLAEPTPHAAGFAALLLDAHRRRTSGAQMHPADPPRADPKSGTQSPPAPECG